MRNNGHTMDEITAHLDRGWDLLEQGDLDGAERSAEQVLALDAESAEAYILLGVVAASGGNPEQGMEHLRKAIELDPDFADPYLRAAEVALYQLDDPDEALHLVEEALERAEEDEDYVDGALLKVEILITRDSDEDEAAARAALAEVPREALTDPGLLVRAGHAHLELDEIATAEDLYRQAVETGPEEAEAWYGLGLCAEARDDERAAIAAWLKVRELDLGEEPPPWTLSEAEFEATAEASLAALPERIRARLENVPIIARDYPPRELIEDGNDPRMLGFFAGVPYPEQQTLAGAPPHLDCIFLFQRNIERVARSRAEVREEISVTLLHETGHFFALDEDDLARLGLD